LREQLQELIDALIAQRPPQLAVEVPQGESGGARRADLLALPQLLAFEPVYQAEVDLARAVLGEERQQMSHEAPPVVLDGARPEILGLAHPQPRRREFVEGRLVVCIGAGFGRRLPDSKPDSREDVFDLGFHPGARPASPIRSELNRVAAAAEAHAR